MNQSKQHILSMICKKNLHTVQFSMLLMLFTFAFVQHTLAASPLVSASWLQENLSNPNLRIVDLQPNAGYKRVHLPGAVNTQYNQWRQPKPVEGKALPSIAYLEKLLGSLGISNESHVILTPIGANASEQAIATRIYWTLKVLGHKEVSILDGGLIAFSKLPNPDFTNMVPPIERTQYKATPDLSMVPSAKDVLSEWKKGTAFVDYRSEAEYYGKVGGTRRGTIPKSKNLPFDRLVGAGKGGQFLSKSEIETLYANQGINISEPIIGFCQSGHRASLAWFVAHEILGNKEARLYDGSMSEWSQYPDHPIAIPE